MTGKKKTSTSASNVEVLNTYCLTILIRDVANWIILVASHPFMLGKFGMPFASLDLFLAQVALNK